MVSLEQVRLLETKVAKAIDYVERVSGENAALQEKLESYQKRIDELEVLVQRFKEEQGRIEDGILSALDRLNQFEDAIEKSLAARGAFPGSREKHESAAPADEAPAADTESGAADESTADTESGAESESDAASQDAAASCDATASQDALIPDDAGEGGDSAGDELDVGLDPAEPEDVGEDDRGAGSRAENGELDIF
jgi:chromosome segregation ATPase